MKRPDINTASREELVKYIEYMEGIINGASKLQVAMANTCDVIANDLNLINEGKTEGLKILNSDEKYFERINLMVKNKSDWSALRLVEVEETQTTTIKKKRNIQDFVSKPK